MSVNVDVEMLQRMVRDQHGLEIDRDLAERMQSTIQPALNDLETARARIAHDGAEPADFDMALLDLAPEAIRIQAARFRGDAS